MNTNHQGRKDTMSCVNCGRDDQPDLATGYYGDEFCGAPACQAARAREEVRAEEDRLNADRDEALDSRV